MLATVLKTRECRHGVMSFLTSDTYIGVGLDVYGEYSEEEVQFLLGLIGPEDVVVDVGANIGALTVPLARAAKEVIAFEPQQTVFDILEQNIRDNDLSNAKAWNWGVGARQETMYLPSFDYATTENYGGIWLASEGEIPVEVTTIDDLNLDTCRLIKIDVEGMEESVLLGAVETIARCRPLIYCEHDGGEQMLRLVKMFADLGYKVWAHKPTLFNPENYRRCSRNIFGNIVSSNMLAVPVEMDFVPSNSRGPLVSLSGITPAPARTKGWACVARLGGIGDNLIASSVFRLMREKYGRLEVITQNPAGVVFENNPYIDKLTIYEDGDLPSEQSQWQAWFSSRSKEYDRLVNLSHSCEYLLAQPPTASAFHWPDEFRRLLCGHSYLEVVHDICGIERECDPRFFPTDAERQQAIETKAKIGRHVIGWCLGGSRFDKIYPHTAFVIARLIKECGAHVMMFGAPGRDFEIAQMVQGHVRKQNGSDAGLHLALSPEPDRPTWPIRRILSQIHTCDLVIGPDTGPMWAVARENMPKIMLLSHASVKNITTHWINTTTLFASAAVPCWPCHKLHDQTDTCRLNEEKNAAACISDISAELVVNTAINLMSPEGVN